MLFSKSRGTEAIRKVGTPLGTSFQAGVPVKVVSERLGHKTTTITENIYLHVTPQMAEDAADKVANLILGNAGSISSVNNP